VLAGSDIASGSLAVEQRIRLDGIDGFFGQSFDRLAPGGVICDGTSGRDIDK